MKKTQGKRFEIIDRVRILAMLLALYSHACWSFGLYENARFTLASIVVTRAAMPLFAFVFGFMLALTEGKNTSRELLKIKFLKRMALCYIGYAVIAVGVLLSNRFDDSSMFGMLLFVENVRFGNILAMYTLFFGFLLSGLVVFRTTVCRLLIIGATIGLCCSVFAGFSLFEVVDNPVQRISSQVFGVPSSFSTIYVFPCLMFTLGGYYSYRIFTDQNNRGRDCLSRPYVLVTYGTLFIFVVLCVIVLGPKDALLSLQSKFRFNNDPLFYLWSFMLIAVSFNISAFVLQFPQADRFYRYFDVYAKQPLVVFALSNFLLNLIPVKPDSVFWSFLFVVCFILLSPWFAILFVKVSLIFSAFFKKPSSSIRQF